jgi:hypothetical protein
MNAIEVMSMSFGHEMAVASNFWARKIETINHRLGTLGGVDEGRRIELLQDKDEAISMRDRYQDAYCRWVLTKVTP